MVNLSFLKKDIHREGVHPLSIPLHQLLSPTQRPFCMPVFPTTKWKFSLRKPIQGRWRSFKAVVKIKKMSDKCSLSLPVRTSTFNHLKSTHSPSRLTLTASKNGNTNKELVIKGPPEDAARPYKNNKSSKIQI